MAFLEKLAKHQRAMVLSASTALTLPAVACSRAAAPSQTAPWLAEKWFHAEMQNPTLATLTGGNYRTPIAPEAQEEREYIMEHYRALSRVVEKGAPEIPYYFPLPDEPGGAPHIIHYTMGHIDDPAIRLKLQQTIRDAEHYANLKFVESPDAQKFEETTTGKREGVGAPDIGVKLSTNIMGIDPIRLKDSSRNHTPPHEVMHFLGAGHYYAQPSPEGIALRDNEKPYTVMQYTDYQLSTLGIGDVAYLQAIFGPNLKYNAGDTTYTYTPEHPVPEGRSVVWDAGGNNTVEMHYDHTSFVRIDLHEGMMQGSAASGIWVEGEKHINFAYGTMIQNAVAAPAWTHPPEHYSIQLIGNALDNVLELDDKGGIRGERGDDVEIARHYSNTVFLEGGEGADTFVIGRAKNSGQSPRGNYGDVVVDFAPEDRLVLLDGMIVKEIRQGNPEARSGHYARELRVTAQAESGASAEIEIDIVGADEKNINERAGMIETAVQENTVTLDEKPNLHSAREWRDYIGKQRKNPSPQER